MLAAGASARMGGTNKLLEPLEDAPLVVHVVAAATRAGADPIVVVAGHQSDALRAVLRVYPVEWVENARWAEGMGTSVAAGVAALDGRVDGVLVCLGDMPRVDPGDLAALIRAFGDAVGGPPPPPDACVPEHGGRRGNPVLWSARCFARLRQLAGDRGARGLLDDPALTVLRVPAGPGVLIDADTPAALDALRRTDEAS